MNPITAYLQYLKSELPTMENDRYSLFPLQDEKMYEYKKMQEAALWSVGELDFTQDIVDYSKLSPTLKGLVIRPFKFFVCGDGAIMENIELRMVLEARTMEQKEFFRVQSYAEGVHNEAYSLFPYCVITDPDERSEVFRSMENTPCVMKKMKWISDYMLSDTSRALRYAVSACMESIGFQAAFLCINFFRSKKVMKMMVFLNEQIAKDEGIHTKANIHMYNRERELGHLMPSEEVIRQLVEEFVNIELEFADYLLPQDIEDFTREGLFAFVRTIGNYLLEKMGYAVVPSKSLATVPTWIQDFASEQKSNFYEERVGSYKQFSLKQSLDWKSKAIGTAETVYTDFANLDI